MRLQAGQRVIVMGLAKSGEAVARLLLRQGVNVIVNDQKDPDAKNTAVRELRDLGAEFVFGGHPLSLLDFHPDFIVKNPGIPYSVPLLQEAKRLAVPIYTEIEVSSWLMKSPLFAITGSNGKTTTTTLIGQILDHAGQNPVVAGNIGRVLSGVIEDVAPHQPVVLEVSSFQLMGTESLHPKIAVLLNLYPAHLDYHKTFDNYAAAKMRLFQNMTAEDTAVLNYDQPQIRTRAERVMASIVWFSQSTVLTKGVWVENSQIVADVGMGRMEIISVSDLGLPHNLENTLAAVAVALLAGTAPSVIADVLSSFSGVEHRMELVARVHDVTFYNDSKATNPQAALRALQSFDQNVIWIGGGLDRGDDYAVLQDAIQGRVKAAVLLGQSAARLEQVCSQSGIAQVKLVSSIEEAVAAAALAAAPGDVVLLSPACASWDMFNSFEERGSMFKQAVHRL
ncbi:UDP-N-acetylmuramoyl-L-alanine--D-glutamate ligase [Alicyclobacillus sp. SO9]|uniref:UDP-N-acetylmuramoyl-L-alanine--D-glutamate ligase n=1 Tax=Alicyclobacillus sp. SO9 TaxID=2665646 RepID=UPI00351BF80A